MHNQSINGSAGYIALKYGFRWQYYHGTEVYRALIKLGFSQHQISRLTGQSQSEVSEIIKGRRVVAYDVLRRIAPD